MSFIERIRSKAAARASSSVQGLASSASASANGVTQQVRNALRSDVLAPLNSRNFNPGMLADAAFNSNDPMALIAGSGAGRLLEESQARAARAKAFFKPPARQAVGNEPIPTGLGTSRLWGNLSFDDYRANFLRAANIKRSWKNLFYVEFKERVPTKDSFANWAGLVNMLALDVSLSPYTMPGEAIAIGGANMDRLASDDRVELRMTTMDDEDGSIKRWFMSKCDQASHQDGTFGVPSDYLLSVTLTHMASAETERKDPRLSQRFLMRPSSIEMELSRRTPELEELSLSFVQFDTFMEAP